jgi:hypothetical protein
MGDYDLDNDPHGLELHRLKTAITNREKLIAKQEEMEPKLRAKMWKYLSRESMEAVLRHEDYDEEEHRNNPPALFEHPCDPPGRWRRVRRSVAPRTSPPSLSFLPPRADGNHCGIQVTFYV